MPCAALSQKSNLRPGKTRLESISEELKIQGLSSKKYYNADGVIKDNIYGCELAFLETSGPFGLDEVKDYNKAAYRLLLVIYFDQ